MLITYNNIFFFFGKVNIVELLLSKGANVNDKDNNGESLWVNPNPFIAPT